MIAVTLTLSALISLLFLGLGGVIGWLAKDVVNQKNTHSIPCTQSSWMRMETLSQMRLCL